MDANENKIEFISEHTAHGGPKARLSTFAFEQGRPSPLCAVVAKAEPLLVRLLGPRPLDHQSRRRNHCLPSDSALYGDVAITQVTAVAERSPSQFSGRSHQRPR